MKVLSASAYEVLVPELTYSGVHGLYVCGTIPDLPTPTRALYFHSIHCTWRNISSWSSLRSIIVT